MVSRISDVLLRLSIRVMGLSVVRSTRHARDFLNLLFCFDACHACGVSSIELPGFFFLRHRVTSFQTLFCEGQYVCWPEVLNRRLWAA